MSIYTVTAEITVRSNVEVRAPAGASTESVARDALVEVMKVRTDLGLHDTLPTELTIDLPTHTIGRIWHVNILAAFRTISFHEIGRK